MVIRKIGFLADTHSRQADGSDLPDGVLLAFKGVDLIVHLGDIGQKGILKRLGDIAPVLVPSGDKGYVPAAGKGAGPVTFLEGANGSRVGLTFNLTKPDKKISVDGTSIGYADGALPGLLQKRFNAEVEIVAFGGTHVAHTEERDGVLFVNPGSPTLPADGPPGSVAVLDVASKKPKAKIVRLK